MSSGVTTKFGKQNYDAAAAYSANNNVVVKCGKRLAIKAGIQRGNKILDMGCDTGDLTSFLGVIVGKEVRVVGVDPDCARIKFAKDNYAKIPRGTVTFRHGDSSSDYLLENSSYYDVYFSNFSFQWLSPKEKKEFLQTAFKCLKPGGKIAIQTHEDDRKSLIIKAKHMILGEPLLPNEEKLSDENALRQLCIKKSQTEALVQESGFEILTSDYDPVNYRFASIDDFLNFIIAADYHKKNMISTSGKRDFIELFGNDDGSVNLIDRTVYIVVAQKM